MTSLIIDKRKDKAQRVHTCWNSKRHIPLVSLLLWRKMGTVHCFIGLQPCDCGQVGGQAGRQADENSSFGNFKSLYPVRVSVFLFLMLLLMLDGLILFHKGDFRCVRCF